MKKNNKRTLILSLISILVCLTMLIGSTFAWFTDTASTAVNKIESGTLDIDILHKSEEQWVTAVGQTLNFVQNHCTNGRMLWEPGCTYDLEPVKVVNKGNLALKYKIELTGIDGEAELLEVIDWTVKMGDTEINLATFEGVLYPADANPMPTDGGSESGEIVISGHMREEAGNEYQGLSVTGIGITVYATQKDWECDSNGNDYDAEAPLPDVPIIPVTSADQFKNALTNAAPGDTILLKNDITLTDTTPFTLDKNLTIDGFGNTIKGNNNNIGCRFEVTGDVTFRNLKLTEFGEKTGATASVITIPDTAADAKLTLDAVTISHYNRYAVDCRAGSFDFRNCTFDGTVDKADDQQRFNGGLSVGKWNGTVTGTVYGCTFTNQGDDSEGWTADAIEIGTGGTDITVENCVIRNVQHGFTINRYFGPGETAGVTHTNANVKIINCTITENISVGAIRLDEAYGAPYNYNRVGEATVTITGGTYAKLIQLEAYPGDNSGTDGKSKIIINSGNFEEIQLIVNANSLPDGVVTINGGTFTGALTPWYFDGTNFAQITNTKGIQINGGTFYVDPSAYVAEGHTATQSGEIWTVA